MKHQFHIGDLVCLRDWDDLVQTYGFVLGTLEQTISCPFGIAQTDYKHLLDTPMPIKEIHYGYSVIAGRSSYYAILQTSAPLRCNAFALEVLTPANTAPALDFSEVSDTEFNSLLGG